MIQVIVIEITVLNSWKFRLKISENILTVCMKHSSVILHWCWHNICHFVGIQGNQLMFNVGASFAAFCHSAALESKLNKKLKPLSTNIKLHWKYCSSIDLVWTWSILKRWVFLVNIIVPVPGWSTLRGEKHLVCVTQCVSVCRGCGLTSLPARGTAEKVRLIFVCQHICSSSMSLCAFAWWSHSLCHSPCCDAPFFFIPARHPCSNMNTGRCCVQAERRYSD